MAGEESLSVWQRLGYGALGAVAPEIIRWYKIALRPAESDLPSIWMLYLGIMGAYVILGALFATMWRDDNRFKLFYLGASVAPMVSAIAGAH
jgi:hypothetical protein